MSYIIETHNLSKIYNPDTIPVNAVNGVDLHIEEGESARQVQAKQPCSILLAGWIILPPAM
jgi:hypothetical protein